MSLAAAFSVKLPYKILGGSCGIGRLDGERPSLVAATAKGKVFVHTPHGGAGRAIDSGQALAAGGRVARSAVSDVSLLSVNQSVRALVVGRLHADSDRDVVVVGTPTHVLAYDVDNNSDLFYREIPDGVNCIALGPMGGVANGVPLAVCGGNCAIQAFDAQGQDLFWTVTGDNVSAICLADFDGDGRNELIVGSEDYDIRIFKGDTIIAEMSETEAITALHPLPGNRFAYALGNGTLGVYQGTSRVWRIKSKNHVLSMTLFDMDGDGEAELGVGWSSGKLDFRKVDTGEVVVKEQLDAPIAALMVADYRMEGRLQMVAAATDGELRGYLPPGQGGAVLQPDPTQEILHDLGMRKQNLILELKNYEENRRVKPSEMGELDREAMGVIPSSTQLQTSLYVNAGQPGEQPCIELFVSTSNETLVKVVMLFAEGVFPGESHVVHPTLAQLSTGCKIQLRPEKDVAVDLHIKALVGFRNSLQYHVFELSRSLPRFSMYALCNESAPPPDSYVKFTVRERPQRLALWINENFLLQEEMGVGEDGTLDARFFSLRGSGLLFLRMGAEGETEVRCQDMELCGDVVQALGDYLGIGELTSLAHFPSEAKRLEDLSAKVNSVYATRDEMSAGVADQSNLLKALLIRAEDARLMRDMRSMKKYLSQLHNLNEELIGAYKLRSANHEELLASLKDLNQIIQRAGRLRLGKPKTDVVNGCRQAIKDGTTHALPEILRSGMLS